MRPHKYTKIDQHQDYPCPCRRKGTLCPILLTDAFGCDRCQQIFVLQENGQIIEQLAPHYPYKRSWRWTGFRWVSTNRRLAQEELSPPSGVIPLVQGADWYSPNEIPSSANCVYRDSGRLIVR